MDRKLIMAMLSILALGMPLAAGGAGEPKPAPVAAAVADKAEGMNISYRDGKLTVSLKDADLQKVLGELARQANLKVNGLEKIQDKVSLEFADLSLEYGLKKILKDHSWYLSSSKSKDGVAQTTLWISNRKGQAGVSQGVKVEAGGTGMEGKNVGLVPDIQPVPEEELRNLLSGAQTQLSGPEMRDNVQGIAELKNFEEIMKGNR